LPQRPPLGWEQRRVRERHYPPLVQAGSRARNAPYRSGARHAAGERRGGAATRRALGSGRTLRREDLAKAGRLAGYEMTRRFYEIGSFAGLTETDRLLSATRPPVPDPG